MNLDDLTLFQQLDPQNLITHIDHLPQQIEEAWALGQTLPLPDLTGVTQIVFCGMGTSALGGALTAALVANECPVPITILRDYDLPAWAQGAHTLVIASSHSGNTEETLAAFQQAVERKTKLVAITTGGQLKEVCLSGGGTMWQFNLNSTPRVALGFSFILPLALLSRANLVADKSAEVASAVTAMCGQQKFLTAASPTAKNPAKRMAGQFMDRLPLIFGAGLMSPIAHRWQNQVAESSKAWAHAAEIPEMNHNLLAGITNPQTLTIKYMALFLESDFDHPRNKVRLNTTRMLMMTAGFNTDVIRGTGDTPLAHMLTALHYGDYVSYYLAMAYNEDPMHAEVNTELKRILAETK